MRLRDAVVKRSAGRISLHHLGSTYFVTLNEAALTALNTALEDPRAAGPGRAMVETLRRKQMVDDGVWAPVEVRSSSPLVSVEVEPVGRCNLKCGHCFAGFSGVRMSEAIFARVLSGAQALGAVELTFNGGEPLMHRRCVEWIARTRAGGLRPLLFTNGTLVTAALAEQLAKAGLAKATVSLDGFEEAHDALRGQGTWQKTTRGIRRLADAGIPVHVTTMVHPANEGTVTELHRYARQTLGASGVRISTVAELGRAAGRADLQLGEPQFRAVYANEPARSRVPRTGQLPCQAGVDKLYVTASGEVHACHLFDGVAKPLGDLHAERLEDIHGTLSTREAGALLTSFDLGALHACAACPVLETCGGGCRARAWSMTGDRAGVDPVSCRKYGVSPAAAFARA